MAFSEVKVSDPPPGGPRKRRRVSNEQQSTRRFRSRGVDVEIREAPERAEGQGPERVEVMLDGRLIPVTFDCGEYYSQLANQFTGFATIDDLVETLLANEGRTWTLHGELRGHGTAGPHGQPPDEGGQGGHGGHGGGAHEHGPA